MREELSQRLGLSEARVQVSIVFTLRHKLPALGCSQGSGTLNLINVEANLIIINHRQD